MKVNLRRSVAFLLALIMFVSGTCVCFADEQTAHYDLNLALTEGDTFDVSTLLYESDRSYEVMLYSSDEAVASVSTTKDVKMIKDIIKAY